ncbi:MAG: hypothetical protein AB7V62_05860 [Thermoleophilia bacterium]
MSDSGGTVVGTRARWTVLALGCAAVLLPAAAAAGAAPPTPVRVTSPAADAVVRTPAVTVVARVPAAVARVRVRVNRRHAGATPCVRGVCRMRVTRAQGLRPGANVIAVGAKAAGRPAGRDGTVFEMVRRSPGLVSVRVPRRVGGWLVIRSRVPRDGQFRFVVTLIGKRIDRLFDGQPGPELRLRMGAGEGVRHGRNVVRVSLIDRRGREDVQTRSFRVAARLPIAAAGPDRVTRGNAPVTLTAARTRPARGGGEVAYRWTVVSAPPALLTLQQPDSPSLTFSPPAVGRYVLRMTATQTSGPNAGATTSDLVTVTSGPTTPPIGIPLDTGATSGGAPAVTVGGDAYALGSGDAVIALALDRGTLQQLMPTTSYAANEASQALSDMKNAAPKTGSALVVLVNVPGQALTDKNWGKVVTYAGGTAPATYFTSGSTTGFAVIGTVGDAGNAYALFPPAGTTYPPAIDGYLQVASNGVDYLFAPGDYPSFDTSSSTGTLSNTMTINGTEYPSDPMPSCATGGFQMLIVSSLTMEVQLNKTTATAGCPDDANQQVILGSNLASLPIQDYFAPSVVLLQSIGAPRDVSAAGGVQWARLAGIIATLGGTAEVFWNAGGSASQPYALAGVPGAGPGGGVEASAALTGGPGRVSGLMRHTKAWTYAPSLGSPGGTPVPMAPGIAYQAPTPWPLSQTPAHIAAQNDIATRLGLVPDASNSCELPAPPGPRGLYCSDENWTNQRISLNQLSYETTPAYTSEQFTAVQNQLNTEFTYVANLYSSTAQMEKVLGRESQGAQVDLNTIVQQVVSDVESDGSVGANMSTVLADVLNGLSYAIGGGAGANIAKALATLLQVSATSAQDATTGLPLNERIQVRAKDLGTEMDAYYQAADDGLAHIVDIIVSDWGKLSAASTNPVFSPVSTRTQNQTVTMSSAAVSGYVWGQLMPMGYQLDILQPGKLNPNPSNPATYQCSQDSAYNPEVVYYHPFGSLNPVTVAQLQTPVAGSSSVTMLPVVAAQRGAALPGDDTYFSEFPSSPPAGQMNTLFSSIVSGGYGQFPAAFLPKWFGTKYTSITC